LRFYGTALVLAAAVLLCCFPARSQSTQSEAVENSQPAPRLKPSLTISKDTLDVSCWSRSGKFTGSHLFRSPIFSSQDGSERAYVEVEAIAFQPKDEATYTGDLCENTSRLFLAGPGDKKFRVAYSQSLDFSDGNSLNLVDWSPEGMRLLVERGQWAYESEGDYTDFILLDAKSGAVIQPDLDGFLAARFGRGCGSDNSILGFTPEGQVAVMIAPLSDPVAVMNGAKSCVERKTLLAIDLQNSLHPVANVLPSNFKVIRYGRFQALSQSK
jgi:hypothetical protein